MAKKTKQKAKGKSRSRNVKLSDLNVPKGGAVKGGAADIFAKLGDIKGESMDDKHKDEITLAPSTWRVTRPGSRGMG